MRAAWSSRTYRWTTALEAGATWVAAAPTPGWPGIRAAALADAVFWPPVPEVERSWDAGRYLGWVHLGGMREAVGRAWLEQPVPLLAAFLVLSVLAWPVEAASGGSNFNLPGLLILLFLTWRVAQGGRISRMLLILLSAADYSSAALHVTRMPAPADLWLLAASAGQVALLVSPAVYQRTRRSTAAGSAPTALAGRPRPWMLPWGLLAGLVITLLSLAQMRWAQLPGCGPARAPLAHLPGRCIGLAEGSPLRFLFTYQGVPKIDKLALITDWAQWSLIGTSALYALEVLRAGRAPAARSEPRPEPAVSRR